MNTKELRVAIKSGQIDTLLAELYGEGNVKNQAERYLHAVDEFEKLYGVTPIKYINALKLSRAKELLSSGMYSVSEAAYHSGFSDVSHFSRFFKEHVGVLPGEYTE